MRAAIQFDSRLMEIQIVGSTIRYTFLVNRQRSFEIRNVTDLDLARLRRTIRNDRFSSSATVQLLTHRYKESHFTASGRPARPSRIPAEKLLPMTPFARCSI
jgi:hypothetical protein